MQTTFLDTVAARYATRDNRHTLFVFPNRRAALFFQKAMSEAGHDGPVRCTTTDALLSRIAGLRPCGRIAALAELHRCWQMTVPDTERTSFDSFLAWGDVLLSDIDAAESAGVSFCDLPRDLTTYLASVGGAETKALAKSIEKATEGGIKERLLSLWPVLGQLQRSFRSALVEKKTGTAGVIAREAAAAARSFNPDGRLVPEHVVAVGLAAMTVSEKAVHDRLHREGAEYLWDFAGAAITDPSGPVATMMNDVMSRYPSREPIEAPALEAADQTWSVVHVPSSTGEARAAGAAIGAIVAADGSAAERTAVILADESLLMPVLCSIPETVENVNVTMGYPLSGGSAASLLDALSSLRRRCRSHADGVTYHRGDIAALLSHPFVKAAAGDHAAAIAETVRKTGRVNVDMAGILDAAVRDDVIPEDADAVLRLLFADVKPTAVPSWVCRIAETIQRAVSPLEREELALYHKLAADLEASLGADSVAEADTWFRLFRRAAAGEQIPFEGEPLCGLQVMGALETRCLDMENVIWVGASEGMLPAAGGESSLLPPALREALGLQTAADRQAVAAYHFWRSTCRARRIWLIHDCRAEGLGSGEESRFIKQLRYLYHVPLNESFAADDIRPEALSSTPLSVTKTEDVMRILEDKFITGTGAFSATSINTYIDCHLRYWWEHVLGVKESKDAAENLDAALFGTVYHAAMENIYRPFVGKTVSAQDIDALAGSIPDTVTAAFAAEGATEIEGRMAILRDVVVRLVERTLEEDRRCAPLEILGVEQPLGRRLALPGGRTVRLFGLADRIDRPAGSDAVRIVDYKTGSVKGKDDTRSADRIFDTTSGSRPSVALQLYLYENMARTRDGGKTYAPCIYSTRALFDETPKSVSLVEEEAARFEDHLKETIEEIFNPAVPFNATDDTDKCTCCPMRTICNRH